MKNGETPQHIIYWSPMDWLTCRARMRSIRTGDRDLRLVYFELLARLYTEGGDLPSSPASLEDYLDLPSQIIAKALPILTKLGSIQIKNGRLTNPRTTKELAKYKALSDKKRAAARARWDASAMQTDADAEHPQCKEAMAMASGSMAMATEVFNYWREKTGHTKAVLTATRTSKLKARLSEDPDGVAGVKRAVDGAIVDPFYAGDNEHKRKYWSFDNVFRSRERVEKLQDSAKQYGKPAPKKTPAVKLPPHDNDAAALLEEVKGRLDKVPAHSKRTWIDPCSGWAFENDGTVLVIACPSTQHADWLRGYFKEPLKKALQATRPGMLVRAVVREVTP